MELNALVFYTSTDRKGRPDATGAFIPEAKAFQRLWMVDPENMIGIPQNIPRWKRRIKVIRACKAREDAKFDAFVYFGHGSRWGLSGLGFYRWNINTLVKSIVQCCSETTRIVLYACLAGRKLGFADKLHHKVTDHLTYAKTVAHLTAGHASWNPYAEWSGIGPKGKGLNIIDRDDPLWPTWRKMLRADQDFRLSFPFMSPGEIDTALTGNTPPPGGMFVPMRP
jgi:hypothetical protein